MIKKSEFKEEFSISTIFKIIINKIKFILFFVVIFCALVLFYSYIEPQQYRAQASLLPPEDAAGMGGFGAFLQSLSGGLSIGAGGQPNKLILFQEILKSREVAKKIADLTGLAKKQEFSKDTNLEPLYSMISNMLFVEIRKSGLIVISGITSTEYFSGRKEKDEAAKLAADVVNASIKGLDMLNREKSVSKAKRKKQYIERVLVEKKLLLNSIDSTLEQFRLEHKIIGLDDQSKAVMNNAISIGSELAKAEIDMNLKLLEYEKNAPNVELSREKYNTLANQFQKIQKGGITNDYYSIPFEQVPTLIRNYTNMIRDQKILEQLNIYLETEKYQEAIQEESDISTVEPLDLALVPKIRISPDRKMMLLLGLMFSIFISSCIVIGNAIIKGNLILKKIGNSKQSLANT